MDIIEKYKADLKDAQTRVAEIKKILIDLEIAIEEAEDDTELVIEYIAQEDDLEHLQIEIQNLKEIIKSLKEEEYQYVD